MLSQMVAVEIVHGMVLGIIGIDMGRNENSAVVVRSNLRPTKPIEINYEPLLAGLRLTLPTRENQP